MKDLKTCRAINSVILDSQTFTSEALPENSAKMPASGKVIKYLLTLFQKPLQYLFLRDILLLLQMMSVRHSKL